MDENLVKRCCPNCSQPYRLKSLSPGQKENFPLFLKCGHGICENCVRNIVKFLEPIECKICQKDMEIDASSVETIMKNNTMFYELFPINLALVGELALRLLQNSEKNPPITEVEHYINLQKLLETRNMQGKCLECNHLTTTKCKQCETNLCESCFNKTHKNFVIFQSHILQSIESNTSLNDCKIHKGKLLDYYCKSCCKSICMDCMIVGGEKSCQKHDVVTIQEMNECLMEELSTVSPKVTETFKRLTKTAVDIGTLLYNMDNDSGPKSELTKNIMDIEQHFSKLLAAVHKHKQEIIKVIIDLKCTEQKSLKDAKNEITDHIKEAHSVMKTIEAYSDPNKFKQVNLSVLLEKAKKVAEIPWYLKKEETNNDPLKIIVDENLCDLVKDYIKLEGNAKSAYKLYSSAELGDIELPPPPNAPVYPPEFPKDVRQIHMPKKVNQSNKENNKVPTFHKSAPKYRAKSASISSLNSTESETSCKSYFTSNDVNQNPKVHPVMPFKDSQQPKPLIEGSQELIYMSHIVDPHNFYVQRACHQGLVKEMLREFKNASTLPRPSLNHATEGKIYLAFNKADNMWQRCRVVSIDRRDSNNPVFHVFCIDFGSVELLTIDKLRLLPPARVQSPYPLAIHCCLANCVPKSGAWSQEDSLLIHNIINNKQAIIHVRRIRSTSNYSMTLDVDLTTFDNGVSIAHALVFHERAKMPNPNIKYPMIPDLVEKPRIFKNHNDFKYKSIEEVFISHVQSPDKFFIRKRHFDDTFKNLCEDLEQDYNSNENMESVYLPDIGMVCVVNLEKVRDVVGTVRWARAVVNEFTGKARVRIALPDIGGEVVVHWTALRHIRHKYTTFRALATECYLAGITPLNKKWSPGSVTMLQKYANKLLELHVEDTRNRNSLGVVLYHETEDQRLCINNEMIKHQFAVSVGVYKFNSDSNEEYKIIKNKPLIEPKKTIKPKQDKVILKKQTPIVIKERDLEAKDKGPLRLEAKVLNYQSPSLIYFSLVHQQKSFNELFEKLQKHYSKKESADNKDHEWAIGDRCCTFYSQSQTWRRAVILEVNGDNATVFYTDFAVTENVPLKNLQQLTQEFANVGDAALKCHLCSVVPAVGSEWPSLTKEYLKELLDAYKRVFITKVGNFKDKSMPVEIWVYHTIQGGALEPNRSEWRCLNKKIIEQGLGVPDKEQEVTTESNTENATDDETLSFLNLTGSVRDWLQLEPMPIKTQEIASGESSDTSQNVMYITDWLPPEPLQCNEFIGMPTYVDNDAIIYLHDVSQQETLDLIRKALDVRFKQPDPKASFVSWSVGEPCIALYYLDKRFYRGRVLEVNDEQKTCLIHYVDYGNEDTCSFENMRKTIALHQIPVQAHKCILDRIVPINEKWDRETLDYIHKSVVEKLCNIKISGDPIDGVIPIELKFDKLFINDHLVEFELAKYKDGSKALIHKFASTTTDEDVHYDSDSGPDYIIEDDSKSEESFNIEIVKGRDWNTLLDTDDSTSIDSKYINFVNFSEEEFVCNIFVINDVHSLELSIIFDDETTKLYEDMFAELQVESQNMPPLNGIIENKACVALFKEDNQWYRASILQYSEAKGQIKVRYVDYGNIGIISLSDAREIREEWAVLPPGTLTAKLYGLQLNPEVDVNILATEYTETFMDKGPFNGKLIEYKDSIPYVKLKNESGELVYQSLIAKKIFIPNTVSSDD